MRRSPCTSDGPGDRMSSPSISWISPAVTAPMVFHPGRAAMAAAAPGFPHHDARMISGSRAATSAAVTMRSDAERRSRNSANTSRPPATSIRSETQPMPAMSGSIHSSKYTRGRSGHTDVYSCICVSSSRMSATASRAAASQPSAPPIIKMAARTSSSRRWLVHSTSMPAPISSPTISRCRSEKASTRSGWRARILSVRKVVKPPTRARSRTASGRRAVPGTPTTRSPAPSMNAISAVSAVRQTMRWGNSTPVLPYTGGSAGVRRLQDFGERAVQQPVGERLRQGPRALDLAPPGPHTGGEARVARVDAGQGAHVRVDHQVHLEAGIAHADVASRLLQHQPGRADLHAARGDAPELEADDDPRLGQARDVDAPVHGPHQQRWVEVVGRELVPAVPLPPGTEALHHLAELLAGLGQPVLAASAGRQRAALDDAGILQLAQALAEQRAGDQRHPAPDLVEPVGAREQLAQDQRRPPLGEDLRGDGDRAELAIAFHGPDSRHPAAAGQVHFLVFRRAGRPAIVLSRRRQQRMTPTETVPTDRTSRTDWLAVAEELLPAFAARAAGHDADDTFVAENFAELRRRRLFSAAVPVELGGGGASHAELCEVLRTLAHACSSTALAFSMHTHQVLIPVWRWRHDRAPVDGFLRRLAAEELILASSGGSDWLTGSGRAEKVDGGYRVTARKIFASGAPAADLFSTMAVYEDPLDGPTVLHFMIPFEAPGVKIHDNWR